MIRVADDRINGDVMMAEEGAALVLDLDDDVVLYCRLVWRRDVRTRHRVSKVPWVPFLVIEDVWMCESPVSSHSVIGCEEPGG